MYKTVVAALLYFWRKTSFVNDHIQIYFLHRFWKIYGYPVDFEKNSENE